MIPLHCKACGRFRKKGERCRHGSKPTSDMLEREAEFLVRLIHGELPRLYQDCQKVVMEGVNG